MLGLLEGRQILHCLEPLPVMCAQGTFLVRPSLSLAGAMVLSVVVDGIVKHMALDGNQLDTRSLEVWVRDVREAVELLDEATGQRTPKEQVSSPSEYSSS